MRAMVSRLLGLSRAGPTPEWLPCLAGLLDALRATDHGAPLAFADCAFPRHALFHVEPTADLLRLPEDAPREDLHAAFNAAGGSRPVPVCTDETVERLAAGKSLWLHADGFASMRPLLPVLAGVGAGIICPDTVRDAGLPPEWMEIRPTLPDGTAGGFVLFLPRSAPAAARLSRARPSNARRAKGVLPGLSKPAGDGPPTLPIVPREPAANLMIDASRLVTDNGYIAEQAELWSWLWTGPAQMSRFALGRVSPRAARVEVHFIPSELHRSLGDNLVLQLDGRIVPHRGEFSRDGSGRAWIDLADASFTILTVACRTVQNHGGRQLRACISRIGFAT